MTTVLNNNPLPQLAGQGLLIGDSWHASASGGQREMFFAGTGEVQAEIPVAGVAEIDAAVAAAKAAFPSWSATSADERGRLLFKLADLLDRDRERLAQISTFETGRPIGEVRVDVNATIQWTRYFAGYADKSEGRVVHSSNGVGGFNYVLYQPYGVVAALTPYNVPLLSMGMKLPAILAGGNTTVVKPAELTPFSALAFAELALEAGFPRGVINVVTGGAQEGDHLVRHPDVAKVSFTGGSATATKIMQSAAESNKPLALELGGKSANIVFPDANLDAAAPMALVLGSIAAAGQGCVLGTRLFVHEDIYGEFRTRLTELAKVFTPGDPRDENTRFGPVISAGHRDRILGVIEQAKANDYGNLAFGGTAPDAPGYFVNATLFTDVDNDSPLAQEEIFGPVLAMIPFKTEEEVIEKANHSQYGLSSYIQTQDVTRAHRVAAALETGSVNINGSNGLQPGAPFGGVKRSGIGREGGTDGLYEFLYAKSVFVGS